MALSAGTRIGAYEIFSPLGAGGMGEVYRARDTRLKRDVALKVLPDSFANDPDRMARFQREAEVLAALNHPNIAAIYGVEERALVMELVEGEDLAGPLPVETAINFASQIALALEAAHDKGIIHRDLKPANIKITPAGVVKVLDFGLAAVAQGGPNASDQANSPTLTIRATQAGLIMGTAGYMSPEQAAAKPVDRRADIWSFGVVLWEMLTGKRLFDGETVSHTLAAVLTKDPDWTQLPSATPPNVRRLLHRCLERDIKRRLHDMGDAWIELNTTDEPLRAPTAQKPSFAARWLPWIAAAIVAGGAIVWSFLRPRAEPPRPVIRAVFGQDKLFGLPAISRDGTRLVYTEIQSGANRVVLRQMDQLEARPIPGAESAIYAAFSPDAQWLAYYTAGAGGSALMKVPISGGPPITLCQCVPQAGISWGDDHRIVFSDGRSLFTISEAGGTPEPLIAPNRGKGERAYRLPFVLPGAKGLLFGITGQASNQMAVYDLQKHNYQVVGDGTSPHYVSAGYLTYARSGALLAAPFDLRHLHVSGPEVAVVQGITGIIGEIGEYSVSDNGVLIYIAGAVQGGRSRLAWLDRKGSTQPISGSQPWGTGRLSPDGLHVINSIRGDSDLSDIWSLDVERHTLTRLTFAGSNGDPIWTPDGRRVTYHAETSGKFGIYSIAADGSGKPELLLSTETRAVPGCWTHDGKTLIYTQSGADKKSHIWTFTPDNGAGKPVLLHDTAFAESEPALSPDGRFLAYSSTESGSNEVYVQAFPGPGGKMRISTQGGDSPRWNRNGRELLYWLPSIDTLDLIALISVEVQLAPVLHAGIPQKLFDLRVGTTWDVSPDGNRFLAELLPNASDLHMVTVVNWFDELRRRVPGGSR